MNKTYTVGILGASGLKNVGDDLIAHILKERLERSLHSGIVVKILANPRTDDDIIGLDVLVIGGGGLIYDYDMANVDNYCLAIHKAVHFRIPVYMMGIGVQHVFSDEAVEKYQHALSLVKAISTRGALDTTYLRDTLRYSGNLIESRDLVFLYDDITKTTFAKSIQQSKKKRLALSLSDWKLGENYEKIEIGLAKEYDRYRTYLSKDLRLLAEQYDMTIVCQAHEDEEISQELAQLTGSKVISFDTIATAPEIIEFYRSMDIVVTNRYHGFIASVIAETPVIAVSFKGHKTKRLIDDSFPSIASQYFEIASFVDNRVIEKLMDEEFVSSLCTATKAELHDCIELARKNDQLVKYIAGEMARIYT